jgi:hypothetical protein
MESSLLVPMKNICYYQALFREHQRHSDVRPLTGAAIGGRLFGEQHLRSRLAAASIVVLDVIAVAHG